VQVPSPQFLVVLEPNELRLRDANDLALEADVAVLAEGHLKFVQEPRHLEVLWNDDFDYAKGAEWSVAAAVVEEAFP
jgi:hypothetical protein